MRGNLRLIAGLLGLCLPAVAARADDKLAGLACRSVHLAYVAPEATAFLNEVTVEQSAPGTYFCANGFNHGYFGIQELPNGKKLVIFSVWDPTAGDDPSKVDESKRVRLIGKGDHVRVGRFGGEGTGGQSFLDFDWKVGTPYRFLVRARVVDDRTEYSGYFFDSEAKQWHHVATFSTLARGDRLRGGYSFIEDFLRNKTSATQVRRARFGSGFVELPEGGWSPLLRARFTADSNPSTHIDAGAVDGRFFLQTGGNTENRTTKLKDLIERPESPGDSVGTELPGQG